MQKTKIFKSYAEFLKRENKEINGVSKSHATKYPDWENDNLTNVGCWNCRDCSDCRDCRFEENYTGDLKDKTPTIENIHEKIFNAVEKEDALNMNEWHTCNTTHCRAG